MNARPWKRHLLVAVLIASWIFIPSVTMADEDSADATIQVERVSLFKNGLGFFQAAADLPRNATTVEFGQLPIPVHGTFWIAYPKNLDVRGLYTAMETRASDRSVTSGLELLQANVGRRVRVFTSRDENVLEGTILPGPTPSPASSAPAAHDRYVMSTSVAASRSQIVPPRIVLLETDSGIVALGEGLVRHVEFPDATDGELATSLPATDERPSLRLELHAPSRGQTVGLSFLASGITWAPSYRIDLSDPETARFTAKATVINEVADLDGVQLDLVTGFPNVAFAGVASPVAKSQSLRQFLSNLGHPRGAFSGGAVGQQAVTSNRADYAPSFSMPEMDYDEPATGASAEDLFFYPIEDVRLARGETVTLPLFTADMPYEHVYTWRVSDKLDDDERYRRNDRDEEPAEEIWHSCRLVNTLDMPLTTAPAQFVTDGRLTGQDTAYYTAPGAETTIRINRALNVAAEELELERSRQEDAKKIRGTRYDEVEVGGELEITNRTRRPIRVEVTKELTGEVVDTRPAASKVLPLARGLKAANPRHELVWEVDLEPGASKTIDYVYKVYIRD